jgi:hypothetical protein
MKDKCVCCANRERRDELYLCILLHIVLRRMLLAECAAVIHASAMDQRKVQLLVQGAAKGELLPALEVSRTMSATRTCCGPT